MKTNKIISFILKLIIINNPINKIIICTITTITIEITIEI